MHRESLGPPIDARGRRVPKQLAAPFITRARMYRIARALDDLRTEFAGMVLSERALLWMPAQEMLQQFIDLERQLMEESPAVSCECRPGSVCDVCRGKRWLNALDIRRVIQGTPPPANLPAPLPSQELSLISRERPFAASY